MVDHNQKGGRTMESVANGVESIQDENLGKSREVRLGLVMYGGVSLAVYINGVAHEFFRAVKGQGVYRLIKALTDSDIVVDIISGTSAGGVNGIFLGYALCNNRNFGDTAKLWRMSGGIQELLRDPGDTENATSLLKSREYYQPQLEKALREMGLFEDRSCDASPVQELDLFITGTDVYGNVYTDFDDAGHSVDIKDHRTVFLLQHREGRKAHFSDKDDAKVRALAKLARITSCFPAAFEPVQVGLDSAEDKHIQTWGQIGKEAYFLDGGVLDNKPFTYPIQQIYYRTADRRVDRKLFYVEPDPEAFEQESQCDKKNKSAAPDILKSVMTSVIGIPRYESIADDLRALAEHNRRIEQHCRLVKSSQAASDSASNCKQSPWWALYEQSRLVHLSDRVIHGLFKKDGRRRFFAEAKDRELAGDLVQAFDGGLIEGQKEAIFRDFDIYFPIRRLFRVTYLLYDMLYSESATRAPNEHYRPLLKVLNRQIHAYEIVRSAMEGLVDDLPAELEELGKTPVEIWTRVRNMLFRLLDDSADPSLFLKNIFDTSESGPLAAEDWLPQKTLSDFNAVIKKHSNEIIQDWSMPYMAPEAGYNSLLAMLRSQDERIIASFLPDQDPVRLAFERFERIDSVAFPMEVAADLQEKDRIEVVRISPVDAQKGFSHCGFSEKVSGDTFYHFGGFFKRSWRSNDILWGRIDGLCELVETLFKRKWLEQVLANDERREIIRARFFNPLPVGGWKTDLDPINLFPRAGENTQKVIRSWIEDLTSNDEGKRYSALMEEKFQYMIELMIEAAQLEIIWKDFPSVIVDAQMEQDHWNAHAQESREREKHIDQTVSAFKAYKKVVADAERFEKLNPNPNRPKETGFASYFQNAPRSGAENIEEHIPRLVLLEILAATLLVLRNCVLKVLPPRRAERVRKNLLYRFGLDLPLRTFYRMIRLAGQGNWGRLILFIALNTTAILLLVLGGFYFKSIIVNGALGSSLIGGIIFFGIPVLIFALQTFGPFKSGHRNARSSRKASVAGS
jgi:patatin-related protein